MGWKIRHEGSPKAIDGLTLQQVVEGLVDGRWEVTDEVMGPQENAWVAIENHPQLEEIAADVEPQPPPHHDDETHLDMNAMIDVCLVLLIFFILTTAYVELQKIMEAPNLTGDGPQKALRVTQQQVDNLMIKVEVREGEKGPVIKVEGQTVDRTEDLVPALRRFVREKRKTQLLLDHDRNVPHGIIVAVEDAAKTAGMQDIHIQVPAGELHR